MIEVAGDVKKYAKKSFITMDSAKSLVHDIKISEDFSAKKIIDRL